MKKALAIVPLALLLGATQVEQQRQRFVEGAQNAELILNVLASARVSGSLEFNGKCGPGVLVPDFPSISEPPKPYPQNPADTLRYVFMYSADGRMLVSDESNGIIRVVEAGVQTDILHVRINHIAFDRISDPEEALGMALRAPEIRSFMHSHSIAQPFNTYAPPLYLLPGMNKSPAPADVTSVSGELNDVTLADALDYILKTFPGFWLYQDCESAEGKRVVYFDLFPVPGRIWTWVDGQTFVK
jgi:hypothetical protein